MRNNYVRDSSADADVARSPSCCVRGALTLTLRMSRALGVAPVTLTSEQDRGCVARLATEPNYYGYFLISLIHVCLFSALTIDFTAADKRDGKLATSFESSKWVLELSFMGYIATVGVFGASSRMKTVITCLDIVDKIHRRETVGRNLSAEETKKRVVFLVGTLTVGLRVAAYYILTVVSVGESEQVQVLYKPVSFLYLFLVLEWWMAVALEMQFLFVALTINSALTALNDSVHTIIYIIDMQTSPNLLVLKTGLPDTKHISVGHINAAIDKLNVKTQVQEKALVKSEVPRMISRLIISYGQISEVIQEVNASYEVLLMALLGSFLFYLVVAPHCMIICIYEGASKTTIALALFIIGIHVVHNIMVTEPGSKIEEELQRTRLLVCGLSSRGPSCEQAVTLQLDLLYKQMQLNQASYSPMGICLLNRPLVMEIFGAASTFLTIILQYRVLDRESQ